MVCVGVCVRAHMCGALLFKCLRVVCCAHGTNPFVVPFGVDIQLAQPLVTSHSALLRGISRDDASMHSTFHFLCSP